MVKGEIDKSWRKGFEYKVIGKSLEATLWTLSQRESGERGLGH